MFQHAIANSWLFCADTDHKVIDSSHSLCDGRKELLAGARDCTQQRNRIIPSWVGIKRRSEHRVSCTYCQHVRRQRAPLTLRTTPPGPIFYLRQSASGRCLHKMLHRTRPYRNVAATQDGPGLRAHTRASTTLRSTLVDNRAGEFQSDGLFLPYHLRMH